MRAIALLSSLSLLLLAAPAPAAEPALGAAFADAPLSDGSVAVFGALGFPGLEAGYRQGVASNLEFGGTVGFDYAHTALTLDVPVRVALYRREKLKLAAGGSVGGFLDFGAQYYEPTNWPSAGLRLSGDVDLSYRVGEALAVVGAFQVPAEICLTERGDHRLDLLLGGGAELGLGEGFTFGARALLGPDLVFPRGGSGADTRLGVEVLAALGKRIF
jgi:hypothetical protein